MCVILVKPCNVALPEKKYIENCFSHNRDGAGFMFAHKGRVQGKKGFLDVDSLWEALCNVPQEKALVVHFRFATHGTVKPEASHPFPITSRKKDLKALQWLSDFGCAHNGIIHGFGDAKGKGLSDTQEFIQLVLALPEVTKRLFSKSMKKALAKDTGSKFAILKYDESFSLIGSFQQALGCFWSNSDYKDKPKYYSTKYYPWSAFQRDWEAPSYQDREEQELSTEALCPYFPSEGRTCLTCQWRDDYHLGAGCLLQEEQEELDSTVELDFDCDDWFNEIENGNRLRSGLY